GPPEKHPVFLMDGLSLQIFLQTHQFMETSQHDPLFEEVSPSLNEGMEYLTEPGAIGSGWDETGFKPAVLRGLDPILDDAVPVGEVLVKLPGIVFVLAS